MAIQRLLIANRGEIAIRIARAADELGMATVAICSEDDRGSLHTAKADDLHVLSGVGAKAYLDIEQVLAAARTAGCDAIHPGYGFLAENAQFAARCAEQDITFVGPTPEMLTEFGDKARARSLARDCGVPTPQGLFEPSTLEQAEAFLASLEPGAAVILKAVAGGGGRGIRVVRTPKELPKAFERCSSEAKAAFGQGDLYVERFLPRARHLEVQIIGDGQGGVTHLWERECTLQRRHQKIVEIAPSPDLPEALREALLDASVRLATAVGYRGLGTFEFLVWDSPAKGGLDFAFIEANPRIQVEHTVTEEVTGVDLVQAQLRVAGGASLASLGLTQDRIAPPRGHAIQLRVNMERMTPDGAVLPSGGQLTAFDPPSGPGMRTDTFGYAGYRTSPNFDSLLAKVIVHSPEPDFAAALRRGRRALREFRIGGVPTNLEFLHALISRPEVAANDIYTTFIDDHVRELAAAAEAHVGGLFFAQAAESESAPETAADLGAAAPAGMPVSAPLQGTIVALSVKVGDEVPAGGQVAVIEAMKMEHVVRAPCSGVISGLNVTPAETVFEGHPLLWIEAGEVQVEAAAAQAEPDPDHVRADLAAVLERHALTRDEARPDAVAKRRRRNQRTARENVAAVCDPDTFVEYGPLVVAAQRGRRSLDELIRTTPADGLVAGFGTVNGSLFGANARCLVLAYDATVLAGTQGREGHRKDQRLFELAERLRTPVIFFAEGGGGRPGDTERTGEGLSFHYFARLSGKVPLVGVTAGYCFAGNTAFLGCCHVIIATRNANIGMGGPAMVEGGGLGVFSADEIGPATMHYARGAVDVLVEDEVEAAAAAKRYLSYFQGDVAPGPCADQRRLRHLVPEDRRRAYDIRPVIETLVDEGSMFELRGGWGHGVVTALARIEGKAVGIVANNPMHLAGAIDAEAGDKGARFLQLCDNFGLPVVHLCDTPGIMVGPEAEKTALIRRACNLLVAGANLRVPSCTIIVRKFYGLGMIAMMGGAFKAPIFTVAWPTGEYGAMGLEGAVRLAYRKELEAIEDPAERKAVYDQRVEEMYQEGKALQKASSYDFDDVIDPADSRKWIVHALQCAQHTGEPPGAHPFIHTW
ncbi:pyruvate carboxylase [Phenylobacterium zucineum HLK1]|uniref:Pyruvate carboxylase n=1 Tax=Phenylobacterium zucineum (strain HLK1) TaxID=450851 RepID=B4RH12_PHEZH|nr:carboxyl transferase domain-containing protein [Phenylobacterium zucineum]ACG78960.1 pyruvate carboxylase [Phenylobacterium zucineum HLK1]